LIPVSQLKSVIANLRVLKKGDSVGYSRKHKIEKEFEKVATIPVGYADGIGR
jgi:alanine racemase